MAEENQWEPDAILDRWDGDIKLEDWEIREILDKRNQRGELNNYNRRF